MRCPKCGKAFERTSHQVQVCPNCGLRAPTVPVDDRIMPEGVVGKPHRPWAIFVLGWLPVLHFVFWPLYLLLTFRPLDKQHGRDHPIGGWLPSAVPFVGVFAAIPYAWMELWRLQRSRRARGLRSGLGPFWFILVTIITPLAALGYAVWLQGTHPESTGPFDVDPEHFDAARLTDWGTYADTFYNTADWVAVGLLLALWGLTPAFALARAAASANALWRHIYDERGEAWPWRTESEETELPAA